MQGLCLTLIRRVTLALQSVNANSVGKWSDIESGLKIEVNQKRFPMNHMGFTKGTVWGQVVLSIPILRLNLGGYIVLALYRATVHR